MFLLGHRLQVLDAVVLDVVVAVVDLAEVVHADQSGLERDQPMFEDIPVRVSERVPSSIHEHVPVIVDPTAGLLTGHADLGRGCRSQPFSNDSAG